MDLDLFSYIDAATGLLEANCEHMGDLAGELERFFVAEFGEIDSFLSINSRLKSPQSLQEKIIRNNLYLEYEDAEEMYRNIQDIIGIRIECRFTEDEIDLYYAIRSAFYMANGDGYYRTPENARIFLDLDTPQPMVQKNGFGIYKLDGYIVDGTHPVKFELQIKSLVNVFWGEIDHKVLYKNFNYMLTENFFHDIMHSIKDNLSMIDRQLRILYQHVNEMDSSAELSNRMQVKSLLSKIIHDIFVGKIHRDLGFVIDFNETSDILVEYLYFKCKVLMNYDYGENFIRLLNRINRLAEEEFRIGEALVFDRVPVFDTPFTEKVGGAVYEIVNKEFGWNLFFKIISEVEQSDPRTDFEGFFRYMEHFIQERIRKEIDPSDVSAEEFDEIEAFILDCFARNFVKDPSMNYVLMQCFRFTPHSLTQVFRNIEDYDHFLQDKKRIERTLLSQ